MELPRRGKSEGGGVLSGLKSKLGFASDPNEDFDEEYYGDDQAGDYDDFEGNDSEYDLYGEGYEESDSTPLSLRSNQRYGSSSPSLVSMDDVRSRTQIPDSLNRDPLPERQVSGVGASSGSYRSNHPRSSRMVERAADYMISTNDSDISPNALPQKSHGYDSLFSSTTQDPGSSTKDSAGSFDPYDAYSGAGTTSHNPSRSLCVLRPLSYGEVERVAKILKAGDVVVLSLRTTPDQLAKRVLDFAFGVSSALDASVDCIADKVFAIVRGRSLTTEEQQNLRNQGVL